MRALLVIVALIFGGFLLSYKIEADRAADVEVSRTQTAFRERVEKLQAERAIADAKAKSEAERIRQRMDAVKPLIEAALAELLSKDVTRDDVKTYFYDEIYEEAEKDIRDADDSNQ